MKKLEIISGVEFAGKVDRPNLYRFVRERQDYYRRHVRDSPLQTDRKVREYLERQLERI